MIDVCYGLYDKDGHYSKFVGTSMVSILENTSEEVTFHILHNGDIDPKNIEKFNSLVGKYNQQVKFYDMDALVPTELENIKKYFPIINSLPHLIGTMYRIWIPQVIDNSIKKLAYIDSDTIVHLDVKEFYDIDVEDSVFAAVSESANDPSYIDDKQLAISGITPKEKYFNAGILLINVENLRNNYGFIGGGLQFMKENPRYTAYLDQDLLNFCFANNTKLIPVKYNSFVNNERRDNNNTNPTQPNSVQFGKIYHFANSSNGFGLKFDLSDIYNRLYFEYFIKTPWFNLDMLENIANVVRGMYNQDQMKLVEVTKLMAGRPRVFVTEQKLAEGVRNVFGVTPSEQVIILFPNMIYNLVNIMAKSKGKKLYFILLNNYNEIRQILANNNLIENRDFINGMIFLNEQQGVQFNSYFIVRAM